MKKLIYVFFLVLILTYTQYGQTQLLKVGNAVEFGDMFSAYLEVTVNDVTINGKEYLKRKLGYEPWNGQGSFYSYSYERIEGDSIHYILSSTNTDSLSFNFNWPVGTVSYSSSTSNEIFEKRIDSIYVDSYLIPQDTIYLINWYRINLTTGDTISYGDPFYDKYSRKLGPMHSGLGTQLQGAKVDGVRYGDIMPYPEEIVFSEDSLYSEFIGDTINCFLKNTSEYDVVLDSIYTSGIFPYGYLMYLIKDNDYFFINLFNNYPSHPLDTLNYIIPARDSILLQIYDIDLCAICKKQPNEYFEDTLRFVSTFNGSNNYSFYKTIRISGEGHPSDVTDDKDLPSEFVQEQNYPNPFNPSTVINYQLPVASNVSLKVFDVLGNEIATLVNEEKPAGTYNVKFRTQNLQLSSGIYFYRLQAGNFTETKKMILLR
jgi:hypothetical protein